MRKLEKKEKQLQVFIYQIYFFRRRQRWFVGSVLFYFKHEVSPSDVQFLAFIEVMSQHATALHDSSVPLVKRSKSIEVQAGNNASILYPKYAVISVYDIDRQAGLVQCPRTENQFYVISPYFVFDSNLRATAGNISLI